MAMTASDLPALLVSDQASVDGFERVMCVDAFIFSSVKMAMTASDLPESLSWL